MSPHAQDMHKKLQDEKNGPQVDSGFVWSAVITTFLQPSRIELIHKGKKLYKRLMMILWVYQWTGDLEYLSSPIIPKTVLVVIYSFLRFWDDFKSLLLSS